MQHCRNIKKDATTYFYLFNGNVKDFNECIKLALADHVKLLREESEMLRNIKQREEALASVNSEG